MPLTVGRIEQETPTVEDLVKRLNVLLSQIDRGTNAEDRKAYFARRRQRLMVE